ncbi:arylamine N-acetyltransferase family protein [Sphingomonas flavalba]|uniref:arylamine N-acetyltransferase family protein n=1 Tax=Sphingomonas flavalba TaxID=2559804 RepID=UPI00109E1CD8|nr:arylamine N-acetyltransferase [Sphingomonas flavalba]
MFDIAAYLDRIGLAEAPAPSVEGLGRLQRAHRRAIPFENLDIPLGYGISLEPDAIFAKLVTRRRGGYCFEQNSLYGAALTTLGFTSRPLLARVWLGAEGVPPRTHTLNLVTIDGEAWIADAGFGGSYVPPMRLVGGAETETDDGARHRLHFDPDHGWTLERRGRYDLTDGRGPDSAEWYTQCSFSTEEVAPIDLELSNHWTATRPNTRFTTRCIVSLAPPGGFLALTDRTLTISGNGTERIDIDGPAQWRTLLENAFGITLTAEEVARLPLF